MRSLLFLFFSIGLLSCHSDQTSRYGSPWDQIFDTDHDIVQRVLFDIDRYEVQIIYTSIEHVGDSLILEPHYFNFDRDRYFYPASTVKMPAAFLALEYINELTDQYPEIDMYSTILFDSVAAPQSTMHIDTTSPTGYPNIAHFIEGVFAISDNNAYNRLYEFLGQDYINERHQEKNIFTNSRIRTRVGIGGFDTESNKYANPYRIIDSTGNVIHERDELYALYEGFSPLTKTQKGRGYYDDDLDSVIYAPFEMSEKNFINLNDMQQSLIRVIYPQIYPEEERYHLSKEQYDYLYKVMTTYPTEISYLQSDTTYYDSYVKFLMYGDSQDPIPDHIEIANKVGWAYGYLTDCAYIKDNNEGIDFFLAATIHVNENEIYNDGIYEYESIGIPFLAEVGRLVYQYELDQKSSSTSE